MPEGDTVYRAARLLDRALADHVLTVADLRVPQHATADLVGSRVEGTVSRGKHLLTRLHPPDGPPLTLHTHLKMEGAWRVLAPGRRWSRPAYQARVVLGDGTVTAVGFSLGVVDLLPTDAELGVVGHLGPDLLGPDWDEPEALRRLLSQPDREVGDALRDQTNLAGLGNMYVAELCFVSGLHPRLPVSEVPDLARAVRRGRQMLQLNKERAVQSTTGDLRERQRTWVYRRESSPCPRCAPAVRQDRPPGRERAIYWCPRCQPEPLTPPRPAPGAPGAR